MRWLLRTIGITRFALAAAAATASTAHGQTIFSATSGVVNLGGPGFGTLTQTINQSGLSAFYTANVTNFDSYIASNPMHARFLGNEWFSNSGITAATVTYDFGSVRSLDRFALWNEDASGIGLLNILGSLDGITFSSILAGLTPPDNLLAADYPATVYSFATSSARYFRMEMSRCPQRMGSFPACAIGEVAFRSADVVPEPSTYALLATGIVSLALFARRRRA